MNAKRRKMTGRILSGCGAILWMLMLAGLLGCSSGATARAGEHVFVLKEHLDRTWRDQMLTYEFEAEADACHPESVRMEGPDGPMPVQLSEVENWEGTPFVRRAKVSFYVKELPPLTRQRYVLQYGPSAAGDPVESALTVETDGELTQITTDRIGVRLLVGEREFDEPVPVGDVPAPMQGLRLLDGTWTGGGSLYGEAAVTSYEAQLTASGPVFAEVQTAYRFADGNTALYRFRVPAGDRAVEIETRSQEHHPETGWELTLGGDGVSFPEATLVPFRAYKASEVPLKLKPSDDPFAELSPWAGWWWSRFPTLLRLETNAAAGQVHLNSRDAGAWVEPRPLAEIADFRRWGAGSMGWIWGRMHAARLPLFARRNGAVTIRSNHRAGVRRWTLSLNEDGEGQFETFIGGDQTAHTPIPRLDEVKDMALQWPDGEPINPHLLMDAEELAAAAEESPGAWNSVHNVEGLARTIGALGRIDFMRRPMAVVGRYDALINSDRITPEQRKLYRARTAYLAHRLADPLIWSVQRGYTSGNPNMSLSFNANLGMLALAMRDHPHSDQWLADVVEKMDFWLDVVVDEHGYWPESSHYARVSWANMVHFGIAATRAGVRDYVGDPKFRTVAEFYEKTLTPGDPMRPTTPGADPDEPAGAARVNPPYGRGVRFDVWGFGGPLARATAERYPELSRILQWSWQRTDYSAQRSHRPAGLAQIYSDPDLPAATPDWHSEFFTHLGYLFRQHLGTPEETYLLLTSRMARNSDGEIWPADVGGILKWFAHGTPVATAFPRGPASHVMLVNRVSLAGNWDPEVGESPDNRYHTETRYEGFAPLTALDYGHVELEVTDTQAYGHDIRMPGNVPAMPERDAAGRAPLKWHRQAIMVDDETPGGAQYLVLRDTVASPQPTQWHFWTLTEKLGTPEEVADREAFLQDSPGRNVAPLRRLEGDRFTGIGQYGVDLEYYIAAPTDTPRYTMRYGLGGGAYGARAHDTYQDLMHLQLPGEGAYYVVIFPRRPDAAAPQFTTEAQGRVIRIEGEFGEDLAFLHHEPATVTVGEATFEGTTGHIKARPEGITLNLPAAGAITHGELSLSAQHPARMQAAEDRITISVPENFPGGEVRFECPGTVALAEEEDGVKLSREQDVRVLALPAGPRHVQLERSK